VPELITCRTSGGDVACPGLPTPVPGLYVVEDPTWRKAGTAYAVVHESGIALGSGFASPEGALAAAEAAAGILDWRMSAAAIRQRCLADERVTGHPGHGHPLGRPVLRPGADPSRPPEAGCPVTSFPLDAARQSPADGAVPAFPSSPVAGAGKPVPASHGHAGTGPHPSAAATSGARSPAAAGTGPVPPATGEGAGGTGSTPEERAGQRQAWRAAIGSQHAAQRRGRTRLRVKPFVGVRRAQRRGGGT
jgi:hypothetical protein